LEVIPLPPINPTEFIALVQPLLEVRDVQGLKSVLKSRWTHAQIATLFQCDNPDVRKMAALAFSLVGKKCCLPKLAPLLKDPDSFVNQMAEHAMWSVWFSCGAAEANQELCRGSKAMNDRDYEKAIEAFSHAIELDPGFAEAYNQRAIAKYLQEKYDDSIQDCWAAVERMPCHFGAWAGIGHCHAHQGRPAEALEAYEKALSINPHLGCIREAVGELKAVLRGES
jgi:tetratricopeptide (TPR) repeat protein